MTNQLKNRKKTFAEIQSEWEKIKTLDIRKKQKAIRTISHDVSVSYDKDEVSIEQLELYIKIMKESVKTNSFPQKASKFLTKLITDWLILTGNENATIIFKKIDKISVDSGCIAIADPNYITSDELTNDSSDKNYLRLMNEGKSFIFTTGADGIFNTQLRIVDSLEPILTINEVKFIVDASETATIHIPTGTIAVADPSSLHNEKNLILTSVSPGNYKVCVYFFHIPKKLESFYIVLCKTEEAPKNDLSKVYQVQG